MSNNYNVRIFKPGDNIRPCSLVALCVCYNMSLDEARTTGINPNKQTIRDTVKKLGGKWTPEDLQNKLHIPLKEFILSHSTGIYYVILSKLVDFKNGFSHAISLVDGIIYDANTTIDYDIYEVSEYGIIKEDSANYNTSFLDNPGYFKRYMHKYIKSKVGSAKNVQISQGTPSSKEYSDFLTVKMSSINFKIEFPLNSSIENNESIIKKVVDDNLDGFNESLIEGKFKEFNAVYEQANDCYLNALAACYNVSYDDAKKTGIKSDLDSIIRVLSRKGCKFNQIENDENKLMSIDQFIDDHKQGTYYLVCLNTNKGKPGHAIALIDGTIYDADNHPNYSDFYVKGYFEIKKNNSHVDSSYIDDPKYFINFAMQYAMNKAHALDPTKDINVKATKIGSNTIEINLNNKKFNIDFPIDASKSDNEKTIIKTVDKKL